MSIWASWPDIGEHEGGPDCGGPDGTVLAYQRSHVYPDPSHPPAVVGFATIPGHIGPDGDREEVEGGPIAPYARLDLSEIRDGRLEMIGGVVLTPAAGERLRDYLDRWLGMPMHDT